MPIAAPGVVSSLATVVASAAVASAFACLRLVTKMFAGLIVAVDDAF